MESLTHDELVRLIPLTAAQRAEVDRRLATLDRDRRESVTWAVFKVELERRCP
jgi:hypothetical protein